MAGGRWRRDDGAASVVQAALIMPLLAFALGAVLHLGLYLLSRSVVITAVQEGLTIATAAGGTNGEGELAARTFIDGHAPVDIIGLDTSATATTVSLTATVRTPGVVPGLTRTVRVTQTATREQWIGP